MRTLIVGGEYIEIGSDIYVPERCWRMVRIFSDFFAEPVFARRKVDSTDRMLFSARLPPDAVLDPVTPPTRRRPWELAFPDLDWNRSWYERMIANVDAVYCRFPSWEGMRLYEIAREQDKIVLASIHGDWSGVYQHLAQDASFPRSWLFARLNRVSHDSMLHVAETSRVLFCVGQLLCDQYRAAAPAAVNFANYLHTENDLRERKDTCLSPPYRILFVGQLESRKGVEYLIRAAACVRDRGTDVEISLVGTGEEQSGLTQLADSLGIRDAITFHGYVPFGRELLDLYGKSDLFVLPAVAGEGLPKVLVEAMSQGVPVIATDVGSSQFVIEESGAGMLIEPGDTGALADAIQGLIGETEVRRRMIRAGLAYAKRMTLDHQKRLVSQALAEYVPELLSGSGG
jgi:glycosyltransferase involved in cell wall biosynthesis